MSDDLSDAEIERRQTAALHAIRRYGLDAVRHMRFGADVDRRSTGDVSEAVYVALHQEHTIVELAALVHRTESQVWGLVTWLRKQHRVEVKHWVTSPKGRRVAVYGVTR